MHIPLGKLNNQELALQLKVDNDLNQALAGIVKDDESMSKAERELEGLANKAMLANEINDAEVDIVFYNSDTMTNEQKVSTVLGEDASKADMNAFYDDNIMRQAVQNVKPKEYSLCGANQYNCQDWAALAHQEANERSN